jgi:hypothetical protein
MNRLKVSESQIKKLREYRREAICVKLADGHRFAIKSIAKDKGMTVSILVRSIIADFLGAFK